MASIISGNRFSITEVAVVIDWDTKSVMPYRKTVSSAAMDNIGKAGVKLSDEHDLQYVVTADASHLFRVHDLDGNSYGSHATFAAAMDAARNIRDAAIESRQAQEKFLSDAMSADVEDLAAKIAALQAVLEAKSVSK